MTMFLRALLVLAMGFAGTAHSADAISALVGSAQVVRSGQSINLEVGSTLQEGDQLSTGPSSEAIILFGDGALMAVRPASQVVLQSLPPPSKYQVRSRLIKVFWGRGRYISGKKSKALKVTFETATSTIGIRGTDIEIVVSEVPVGTDPAGTFLKVNQGQAFLVATDGSQIDVSPGEIAFGGAPELVARGGTMPRTPAARVAARQAQTLFPPGQLDKLLNR